MSTENADQSGEDFGSYSLTPSSVDGYEMDMDEHANFQPIALHWSPDELNVIWHQVEDWKASKNRKAQQLTLQGAMTDLYNLSVKPPMDGLQEVSGKHFVYPALLTSIVINGLEHGTDKMLKNHPRQLLARFLNGTKSLPTFMAQK